MAICGAFGSIIPEFNIEEIEYEVNAGEQDLYPDAITKMDGKEFYLEFHHISPDHCIAAEIASYIMGKLQKYAIHYNLAQR